MFNKITTIFRSKTKAQEILLLLNDAKDVVRQGFYEIELPRIKRFCENNNIHFVKSKFKVVLADEETGDYSNKGIVVKENDPREGMYFVYFSKDEEKALLASFYELTNNISEFGKILGYPRCCVDYFIKNFSKDNSNPEQEPTNLYTNLSKRNQDCVILSHFPCSSECGESIELGKKYLETIKKHASERKQELITSLSVNK